jgi:hypothetical protein
MRAARGARDGVAHPAVIFLFLLAVKNRFKIK